MLHDLLGRHQGNVLEDLGRRRLVRHKNQSEVIDDPVHNGMLREEQDGKTSTNVGNQPRE